MIELKYDKMMATGLASRDISYSSLYCLYLQHGRMWVEVPCKPCSVEDSVGLLVAL